MGGGGGGGGLEKSAVTSDVITDLPLNIRVEGHKEDVGEKKGKRKINYFQNSVTRVCLSLDVQL